MAGERPRSTNAGRSGKRSTRLADALAATQEHSVPLLPASESTEPTRASTRTSASYARSRVRETGATAPRRAMARPAPSGAEEEQYPSYSYAPPRDGSDAYGASRGAESSARQTA